MDQVDIDCLSCAYPIKDFSSAVNVSCGHGVVHYNCLYFQTECPTCESMLEQDSTNPQPIIPFQPSNSFHDGNLKEQLAAINESLKEMKNLLDDHKTEKVQMTKKIEKLEKELALKDAKIFDLQKEIYEIKLEKVDQMKKELEIKLQNLDIANK